MSFENKKMIQVGTTCKRKNDYLPFVAVLFVSVGERNLASGSHNVLEVLKEKR